MTPAEPSTADSDRPTPLTGARQSATRSNIWFISFIVLLVAVFLIVVATRHPIRAYWFAYQLTQTHDLREQVYYLTLLSQLDKSAIGAINRLASHEDPNIRELAVFALRSNTSHDALPMLTRLACDDSESVRESAATTMAFLTEQGQIDTLRELRIVMMAPIHGSEICATAAGVMARIRPDWSCFPLVKALRESPHALVRAQAVESLGVLAEGSDIVDPMFLDSDAGRLMSFRRGVLPEDDRTYCLLVVLLRATADNETFSGRLALEREIAGAQAFVDQAAGLPTIVDESKHERNDSAHLASTSRTVGDVARGVLERLTGRELGAIPAEDSDEEWALIHELRTAFQERLASRERAMPSTLPGELETLLPPRQ